MARPRPGYVIAIQGLADELRALGALPPAELVAALGAWAGRNGEANIERRLRGIREQVVRAVVAEEARERGPYGAQKRAGEVLGLSPALTGKLVHGL